jgi:hypothetical protein
MPAREDHMDTAPLTLFARKVSASNRLLFADLRRLRRDILPDGITSREEADVLLGLDHIERLDAEWPGYLTEAVAAFALSTSEPPRLDPATTAWLVAALSAARPRTAAAIVRTIEREECERSADLTACVRRVGRRPAIPA